MTDAERIINHFNERAAKCLKHGKPVRLEWDGIWSIACAHIGTPERPACCILDPDNASAMPIITRHASIRF